MCVQTRRRPRRSPLLNQQAGDFVARKACSGTWAPVGPLAPVAPAVPGRPVAPFWPEAPVAPCEQNTTVEENVSAAHAKSDHMWNMTMPLCQPSSNCQRPLSHSAGAHEDITSSTKRTSGVQIREDHGGRCQYLLRHARCADRPLGASRSRSTCGCASNPHVTQAQGFQMHRKTSRGVIPY